MLAQQTSQMRQAAQMRHRLYAMLEVLFVYALIQTLILSSHSIDLVQQEKQVLGWSYTVPFSCFVLIPALIIWLTRGNWADYGVSFANWRTNLDVGIKAYLVSLIPYVFGVGGAMSLKLDYREIAGGMWVALTNIAAIALMIWILNRHRPAASGRANLILIAVLLLFPIGLALWLGKLSLMIISTTIWQFLLSGFGEEFMFRGYLQSRLNQAFGRPYQIFGIQIGPACWSPRSSSGCCTRSTAFSCLPGLPGCTGDGRSGPLWAAYCLASSVKRPGPSWLPASRTVSLTQSGNR